jgi:hypothetical protein
VFEFVACVYLCVAPRRSHRGGQAGKVGLGKVRSCAVHFEGAVVLHVADFPIVISFVGSPLANVGLMEAAVPALVRAFEPVKRLAAPIAS